MGVAVDINPDDIFFQVMQTAVVKSAVRARAQQIAQKAIAIDKAENGGKATITIVDRVLANGRPVSEVHSTDEAGEYGNSKTRRRATLRRAMGGRGR